MICQIYEHVCLRCANAKTKKRSTKKQQLQGELAQVQNRKNMCFLINPIAQILAQISLSGVPGQEA